MSFTVLAEPARRQILDLLRERERSVGELVGVLGMSQPGVSKHLRVLRESGLVAVRVDAQRRMYQLRPEPLAEIAAWLEPYRRFWSARLDALEAHLDKDAPQPGPAHSPAQAPAGRPARPVTAPPPAMSPPRATETRLDRKDQPWMDH
jgi:DNA-binding transcriptional ArsR family regulator